MIRDYIKTLWQDDSLPAINAASLGNIEQGIADAFAELKRLAGDPLNPQNAIAFSALARLGSAIYVGDATQHKAANNWMRGYLASGIHFDGTNWIADADPDAHGNGWVCLGFHDDGSTVLYADAASGTGSRTYTPAQFLSKGQSLAGAASVFTAGADVASAATINLSSFFHAITGSTTIDNLSFAGAGSGRPVNLWIKGGPLTIRNQGGGTGNIRTLNGQDRRVRPGEILTFIFEGGAGVWREVVPNVGQTKIWDSQEAGVGFPTALITSPTLPTSFKHLMIAWQMGQPANTANVFLQLNGGGNSWWGQSGNFIGANMSSPSQGSLLSALTVGATSAPGVTVGEPVGGFIFLPDYNLAVGGQVAIAVYTGRYYISGFTQHSVEIHGGVNAGQAGATTKVALGLSGGTFNQGRMTVYGMA